MARSINQILNTLIKGIENGYDEKDIIIAISNAESQIIRLKESNPYTTSMAKSWLDMVRITTNIQVRVDAIREIRNLFD